MCERWENWENFIFRYRCERASIVLETHSLLKWKIHAHRPELKTLKNIVDTNPATFLPKSWRLNTVKNSHGRLQSSEKLQKKKENFFLREWFRWKARSEWKGKLFFYSRINRECDAEERAGKAAENICCVHMRKSLLQLVLSIRAAEIKQTEEEPTRKIENWIASWWVARALNDAWAFAD